MFIRCHFGSWHPSNYPLSSFMPHTCVSNEYPKILGRSLSPIHSIWISTPKKPKLTDITSVNGLYSHLDLEL